MWMLIVIPALVVAMAGLLFATDALDCGLARRRIRRSLDDPVPPDHAEHLVATQTDLLLRSRQSDHAA